MTMPTHPFGPGSQEAGVTRLRNLLKRAAELLSAAGMRTAEIDERLEPARALAEDRPFWLRSREGLGVLVGPDGVETFQVPGALPESVTLSDRYHIRPLIRFANEDRRFWLLALSQKRVRLLRGSRTSLAEVPADELPAGLSDTLRWDEFEKRSLQFHTGTSGSGGRRPAVFHGTGEPDVKEEIARYFHAIDRALQEHLRESAAPLVLASVEYLLPLYREANTYPELADEAIPGSPDGMSDTELHARAWSIVSGLLADERGRLTGRVAELWASQRVTPDPETFIPAAHHGRIETLLVGDGAALWGAYDADAGAVRLEPGPAANASDLLELAATETLLSGGDVVVMDAEEMPHGESAVAVLRY